MGSPEAFGRLHGGKGGPLTLLALLFGDITASTSFCLALALLLVVTPEATSMKIIDFY